MLFLDESEEPFEEEKSVVTGKSKI